ncbi:MAG: hypothetical protein IKB86_06175 [Clostridia bacterium]|nr:hypothetical protein [Clostridia bacterium]
MKFFAVNGKRPTRLSEKTRAFAWESLNHKYGLDTAKDPCVVMDEYSGFEELSDIKKYDLIIKDIAEKSRIRICTGEKISGAATFGLAIKHLVPATVNGHSIFSSVSHLTIDFETVLKKGVNFIKEQSISAAEQYKGTDKEEFALSCVNVFDCFEIWHKRYLDELKDREELKDNYQILLKVPFKPAESFYEAVQSIWFVFSFVRLCGYWTGIGRIDWLLGDFLKKDLENGKLTIDEAREILAHFFIKGCEWICGGNYGSGDAQHYQNIVLAGVDEFGNECTNEVTYLVLDIIEELGISDFPTTVRINQKTSPELLTRVAQVIRQGGGVIAVYNEDLIIKSLTKRGYEISEARKFANDGCWEVQVPGKTFFTYVPFDSLRFLQEDTLKGYEAGVSFNSFQELYAAYVKTLSIKMEDLLSYVNNERFLQNKNQWTWKPTTPCSVISVFESGCIEKGHSYLEGGPVYNVISPHIGGLTDVVNSLYAIKKLVFDDRKVTFEELMEILKNNWEGHEYLRQFALNKYCYFGNDNDEVDAIAKDLVAVFAELCDEINDRSGFDMPGGISTFGRQIDWAKTRMATPFGKRNNEVLAANFSPTPGTDQIGATAIIKSYCKADLTSMASGAALDVKLLPSSVKGENGIEMIKGLIKGFVSLGGHFMQLDVADIEMLKQAQEHPEDFQNLSVRVSGWNARFVTLNKEWQDMLIAQTGSEF